MAVYMIQAGKTGPVKIGWANRPQSRLRQLQSAHYERLHIVRLIRGGQRAEEWLHIHFYAARILGEWFSFAPEMLTITVPSDENVTTAAQKEEICRLYLSSERTLQEIGDKYNVTREWVRQILNQAGITSRRPRRSAAFQEQVSKKAQQNAQENNARRARIFARTAAVEGRAKEMAAMKASGASWSKVASAFGLSVMGALRAAHNAEPSVRVIPFKPRKHA